MGKYTHRLKLVARRKWVIVPKFERQSGANFACMKSSERHVLFVEEGAAFAELEGRHLGLSRKDTPMNGETRGTTATIEHEHHERQHEHEPGGHHRRSRTTQGPGVRETGRFRHRRPAQ